MAISTSLTLKALPYYHMSVYKPMQLYYLDIGGGSRGARGACAPLGQSVGGAQGGTILWQASDFLKSHIYEIS